MAPKPKRPSPLDDPPSAEEETSSEAQEEGEGQPSVQPASKNSHPKPLSSESDPEPDPNHSKAKQTLASTKPKDQTLKSKPHSSSAAMQAKSASKRPARNNNHSNDAKRAKKVSDGGAPSASADEVETKKSSEKKLFQRVFSEGDVIAILEGVAEFSSKNKGADPYKCADAFHEFMKASKSLGFDATSSQLKEKIRKLKKKFENNASRGKNGEGPIFSKPHDQKCFDLSKKVWGKGEGVEGEATIEKKSNSKSAQKRKQKPKPEAKAKPNSELQQIPKDSKESGKTDAKTDKSLVVSSMIRFCGLGDDLVRNGVELIDPSKRAELEGKWRELQDDEFDLYARCAELIAEQTNLMLQAKKTSEN